MYQETRTTDMGHRSPSRICTRMSTRSPPRTRTSRSASAHPRSRSRTSYTPGRRRCGGSGIRPSARMWPPRTVSGAGALTGPTMRRTGCRARVEPPRAGACELGVTPTEIVAVELSRPAEAKRWIFQTAIPSTGTHCREAAVRQPETAARATTMSVHIRAGSRGTGGKYRALSPNARDRCHGCTGCRLTSPVDLRALGRFNGRSRLARRLELARSRSRSKARSASICLRTRRADSRSAGSTRDMETHVRRVVAISDTSAQSYGTQVLAESG